MINTTLDPLRDARAEAEVYSLDNKQLLAKTTPVSVDADAMTTAFRAELKPLLEQEHLVFVRLRLLSAQGGVLSTNTYWLAADGDGSRELNTLAPAQLATRAEGSQQGEQSRITVTLTDKGAQPAVAIKLTPVHADSGERVLPAYMSDNYITLLPGESRTVTIDYARGTGAVKLGLRGYNMAPVTVEVKGAGR